MVAGSGNFCTVKSGSCDQYCAMLHEGARCVCALLLLVNERDQNQGCSVVRLEILVSYFALMDQKTEAGF